MKILYLAPETGISIKMSGGAGTHMRGTVEYLNKNNEVITAIGGDLLKTSVEDKKVVLKNRNLYMSGKALLKNVLPREIRMTFNDYLLVRVNREILDHTINLIEKHGIPDVIYERSAFGFDTGLKLSKKYSIPLVLESDVTLLDLIKPRTSWIFNRFFYKWMEKRKVDYAHGIVVMSEPSIKLMQKIWKINHNRIYFKGLGINLKPKKKNFSGVEIDQKYDLAGKFVVGYVGIFQDYQNIPILFETAAKLKTYSNIIILIVGTGARIEEYREAVKRKNLDNIYFTGLVHNQDIETFYNRIDLGVITDNAPHMYPVKYLEFIAKGIPTLVPNYDAFNIFFKNEISKNRFTFTAKSADELSQKILSIKKEYNACLEDTSFSKNIVLTKFTWEKCGERLEAALINSIKHFSSHK